MSRKSELTVKVEKMVKKGLTPSMDKEKRLELIERVIKEFGDNSQKDGSLRSLVLRIIRQQSLPGGKPKKTEKPSALKRIEKFQEELVSLLRDLAKKAKNDLKGSRREMTKLVAGLTKENKGLRKRLDYVLNMYCALQGAYRETRRDLRILLKRLSEESETERKGPPQEVLAGTLGRDKYEE